MNYTIDIWRRQDNKWDANFIAPNGNLVVHSSQGYEHKADCIAVMESMIQFIHKGLISWNEGTGYVMAAWKRKDSKWDTKITAPNGNLIVHTSQGYEHKTEMEQIIEGMMDDLKNGRVVWNIGG